MSSASGPSAANGGASAAGHRGDPAPGGPGVVQLSGRKFVLGCLVAAAGLVILGRVVTMPAWVVAVEVFATIIGLFLLGSFKYQLHKNALTYGMGLVIFATFLGAWWGQHGQSGMFAAAEVRQWGQVLRAWVFSFHGPTGHEGLDGLVHMDTMLFILGLTFFVAVVAQTRLLEEISFFLLRRNKGFVLPTVLAITAVVAFASGIFDGVSMIGLTIRTLVIILMLAQAPTRSIRYAVMVCTAVTTVCGMWLAYGEPPNLIMKANLVSPLTGETYLTNTFFLRYCLPAAVLSYLCIAWTLRKWLRGERIDLARMDVVDANAATVRFLQASRHGEVLTPIEFAENHESDLGPALPRVVERLHQGEALGLALVHENLPAPVRQRLLGRFIDESLADKLDRHYELEAAGQSPGQDEGETSVQVAMDGLRRRRVAAQRIGLAAMLPFVALLIVHGFNHHVPLFFSSFAGFAVAFLAIVALPKVRRLALHEARHEYAEYYFLFPLFLSITLLTKVGFFNELQTLVHEGARNLGNGHMAFFQFTGATFLSATLDNNVVADFASRALHGLPLAVMHLFALAQIAGYALGGCWTHIGCAQSVVAYAFIRRDVDAHYTPVQWIKEMTPVLVTTFVVLTALVYAESALLAWMH